MDPTDWLEEIVDAMPEARGVLIGLGGSEDAAEARITMPEGRIARIVLTIHDEFDTSRPIVVRPPL